MKFDAALDVAVSKSSLCVVSSEDGSIVFETTVETEPESIAEALKPYASRLRRLGHEAGSLAPWLHRELQALGFPVVLLETRHAHSVLKAQRNKTDKNDARGLAQIVRSGWYKGRACEERGQPPAEVPAGGPAQPQAQALGHREPDPALAEGLRDQAGTACSTGNFRTRVREAVAPDSVLTAICEPLLVAWTTLLTEHNRLHSLLMKAVAKDELCRRFMTIPGVGAVTAASFKAAIDEPRRFRKSRTVGAHFGLTSRRIQSGTSIDFDGHISKCGDQDVRTALYEAASAMLVRSKTWCSIKAWGLKIAQRRGHKRAVVAVARKLAAVMHAMWMDGTDFSFSAADRQPLEAPAAASTMAG